MKKLIPLFGAIALIFLVNGCKKQTGESPPPTVTSSPIILSNESVLKVNAVLAMSSKSEQKLAYSMLDSVEKAQIWKQHFENLIEKGGFTNAQNKLLAEIRDFIVPTMFGKKDHVKSNLEIDWLARANLLFSDNQMYEVGFSLGTSKVIIQNSKLKAYQADTGLDKCECSVAHDYCGWNEWCFSMIDWCAVDKKNCGWMWGQDCDGTCRVHSSE